MFARWYVVSLREQKRIEEERRRQEELEQERLLRQKEMEDNQVIEDSLKYVSVGEGERARGLIELSLFTLNYHQAQLLEISSMSKFIHKIMPSLRCDRQILTHRQPEGDRFISVGEMFLVII